MKNVLQKIILINAQLIMVTSICFAQINFNHTSNWQQLKEQAKKENKLIFVDAYTTWCGPCKWMAANTFTNKQVTDFYNSNFINAKIDMEKGEGLELSKTYSVNAYPTLLFINGDGKLIHCSVGAKDTTAFLILGNDAKNPEKQLATFIAKYKSGVYGTGFLINYIYKLDEVGFDVDPVYETYFNSQKENDYKTQQNWNLINAFAYKKDNKQIEYLFKNKAIFEKLYTKDSVNTKIEKVYNYEFNNIVYRKNFDSVAFDKLIKEVANLKFDNSEKIILANNLNRYYKFKNGIKYGETVVPFVEKYVGDNAETLNNFCWYIFELCNDKVVLDKAETWSKKSNQLVKNQPLYMDTYACILAKNNKKTEAIKIETEALMMIKNDPNSNEKGAIPDFEKNIAEWSK